MTARLILEYLLRKFLTEEEFRALNIKSFQGAAHTKRTDTFVDYLKNKTPMPLVKGGDSVVVDSVEILKKQDVEGAKKADEPKPSFVSYDPVTQSEELKQILPSLGAGDKLVLVGADGKRYSITSVAKTRELGGKGKGGTLGPERAAIASLQKQLDDIGKPITVILNSKPYKGITSVVDIKQNQKADFALASEKGPVIFISYKPGSTVKDVISYGGLTGKSADSAEVQEFITAVKEKVSDFEGLGYEFGAELTNAEVAQRAIYGSDFGAGSYGMNNVQALMQGDVKLVQKSGDVYELVSNHTILSPTIPSGPYTPYLNARYAGDRHQFGIKHARVGVVPMDARKNIKNPFSGKTNAAQ